MRKKTAKLHCVGFGQGVLEKSVESGQTIIWEEFLVKISRHLLFILSTNLNRLLMIPMLDNLNAGFIGYLDFV